MPIQAKPRRRLGNPALRLQTVRAEARKDFALAMSGLTNLELDTLMAGLEVLRKTFRHEKMPLRNMKELLSNTEIAPAWPSRVLPENTNTLLNDKDPK